jgi:hypothetical protein
MNRGFVIVLTIEPCEPDRLRLRERRVRFPGSESRWASNVGGRGYHEPEKASPPRPTPPEEKGMDVLL